MNASHEIITPRALALGTRTVWLPDCADDCQGDGEWCAVRDRLIHALQATRARYEIGLRHECATAIVHAFLKRTFVMVWQHSDGLEFERHSTQSNYSWMERSRIRRALCIGRVRRQDEMIVLDAWDDMEGVWLSLPYATILEVALVGGSYDRYLGSVALGFIENPTAACAYVALGAGGGVA